MESEDLMSGVGQSRGVDGIYTPAPPGPVGFSFFSLTPTVPISVKKSGQPTPFSQRLSLPPFHLIRWVPPGLDLSLSASTPRSFLPADIYS